MTDQLGHPSAQPSIAQAPGELPHEADLASRVSGTMGLKMKALEFESKVQPGGQIALPPGVAAEIPEGENLRVVVMWETGEADAAWRSSGRQRFESAYCPEDEVYEQLMDDGSIR